MRKTAWLAGCLVLFVLVIFSPRTAHAEEERRNTLGVFLGASGASGERGFSVGFGYERRLNRRIGVGGILEYSGYDLREGIAVAAFVWHPWKELAIVAAPGLEIDRPDGSTGFLFRVGAEYGITMEKGFELAPELNLDFSDQETTLVVGLTFAKKF